MLHFDFNQFSDFIKTEVKNALKECLQSEGLNLVSHQSVFSPKEDVRYLTRKQVSCYLGIGLSTVDYWARIGKLKKQEYQKSIRFDKLEIDACIRGLKTYQRPNSNFSSKSQIQ